MFAPPVAQRRSAPPQRAVTGQQQSALGPSISNQAMLRQLASPPHLLPPRPAFRLPFPMQAKLEIGAVDDPLEREADSAAESVMRMPHPAVGTTAVPLHLSRKCDACEQEEKLQRQPELPPDLGEKEKEEEEKALQMKAAGPEADRGDAPPIVHEVLRTSGRPLDASTRAFFELRFGWDFSTVRVHADAAAQASARAVKAQAFTVGNDVVFGAGRFAPASPEGRRLLAHELAHVVQQSGSGGKTVVTRQGAAGGEGEPLFLVKMMDPVDAMLVIREYLPRAMDTSQAAMQVIADTMHMPRTMQNASLRVRRLIAAFSLLDASDAAAVRDTLIRPANDKQRALSDNFGALDHRFRRPLLDILSDRIDKAKPAATDKPLQARWTNLGGGAFAYLADTGRTVDDVAKHMSGYQGLADVLAKLNGLVRTEPLAAPRQIVVPAQFITRPETLAEIPEGLRREIMDAQRLEGEHQQLTRFITVRGGHPAGPGAVGVIPLTAAPITWTGVLDAVKYAAGFVVGLIEGAIDAVKDLFKGAWEMIKAVAETVYNLVTGQLGRIWAMVTGWIHQLKLLWANRAEVARDFMEKWEARDAWDRGNFQGEVLGWVMMTVLLIIVTAGGATEAAIAQISGKWANIIKLLKLAQKAGDFGTYAKALTGTASKAATAAFDAMRASRLGTAVKIAEAVARPIVWTARTIKAALGLPRKIADEVTDAIAERLSVLAPYADRIKSLSTRAKRWLFGCRSPCEFNGVRATERMGLRDGEIEARAVEELGEEVWPTEEELLEQETAAFEVDPFGRGQAIEKLRLQKLRADGFEPLPGNFKGFDGFKGGTESTVIENGKTIRVINRPDARSIKSTWVTDPNRLSSMINGYFDKIRGRFRYTLSGVRLDGVRRRSLDLLFEEGSQITSNTLRALDDLKRSAGSIEFRWSVIQSGKEVPSSEYLRTLASVD
jgi:hypothetical protein